LESALGKGTTVRLLFPSCSTGVEKRVAGAPPLLGWTGQGTILLVDDEEPVRVLGEKLLNRLGFRSMTACDGREAIEVFRAHQDEITCVLLDLTMPRMDGRETFLALKQINPGISILLCSGYTEEEAVGRLHELPPEGFLQKPYSLDELAAKLKAVIG
jgi:two-component system cell cycle sensor histidine kinase/response regulator CckA